MAAPLKTQRTARFARQPSVKSTNLRDTMNRQQSRRIKPKPAHFATSSCWWMTPQGDWIQCEIVDQEDETITIKNEDDELRVGVSEVLPINADVVSDMTSLRYLHEPGILSNLRHRLLNKCPYTYMGSILISVNPFEWLPGPESKEFVGKGMNPENPHPYAIAELCSQQICVRNPQNQSVVISGESGSGKTEAAKMVLNHIVNRGNTNSLEVLADESVSSLEERLMKSSPLLEAFGNAKTVRNSNSSRFGKYIRMFFHPLVQDPDHIVPIAQCVRKIAGATIETYLLEKSRVTSHAPEERNYHVFYYLVLAKASGLTSASLSHTSFQDYLLLNAHRQSSQAAAAANTKGTRGRGMERQPSRLLRQDFQDREGITDGLDQFQQIQGALKALNYSESEICSIWNIVGAVLEIGNISFVESETQTGSIEITNRTYLDNAAALLGITDEKLRACLTTTVSTVRGETIVKQLDLRDSINAKNAVCKSLYSSLFQHIVGTINIALANNSYFFDDSFTSIGVLDIFGFESFRKNEFEQMLINYANEVLQSSFNSQVFLTELLLYQSENISTNLTIDQCPNNFGCVTLLDSVLNTLETVSERTIQPDAIFFEAVNKQFDAPAGAGAALMKKKDPSSSAGTGTGAGDDDMKKYFIPTHPKDKKSEFKIKHYAETVTYHAGGGGGGGGSSSSAWGLKNNDKIPKELKSTLMESVDKIVVEMVLIDAETQAAASSAAAGGGGGTNPNLQYSRFSLSSESNDSPNHLKHQATSSPTAASTFGSTSSPASATSTTSTSTSSPFQKNSSKKKIQSISFEFKKSISSLCLTLSQSSCAFIRCIKPNPLLRPLTYDDKYSLQQIKSLGLVQVCSVMQIGLPTRITYLEIKSLLPFTILQQIEPLFHNDMTITTTSTGTDTSTGTSSDTTTGTGGGTSNQEILIASLLYAFNIPADLYQLGRTRLFFKSGQLDLLEQILTADYESTSRQEEIILKVKEALNQRKECEETIENLKAREKEVNELLQRNYNFIQIKRNELIEFFLRNKREISEKFLSGINLNEIAELMSSCQFTIDDVKNYGQGLILPQDGGDGHGDGSGGGDGNEKRKIIHEFLQKSEKNLFQLEIFWKSLNENVNKIEIYLNDNNNSTPPPAPTPTLSSSSHSSSSSSSSSQFLFPIEECFHPRALETKKYFQLMISSNHEIQEIIFDANRCLTSKAFEKGKKLQQQFQEYSDTLQQEYSNMLLEHSALQKDEIQRYEKFQQILSQVDTQQLRSREVCSEIIEFCQKIRMEIDSLREQMIADEVRLKEEILRAKEIERIDRERREIEAAMEYEAQEQMRIGVEETEKMKVEDRFSQEREREERFGRHVSSRLKPILETGNSDDDDDDEEEATGGGGGEGPKNESSSLSIPPIPPPSAMVSTSSSETKEISSLPKEDSTKNLPHDAAPAAALAPAADTSSSTSSSATRSTVGFNMTSRAAPSGDPGGSTRGGGGDVDDHLNKAAGLKHVFHEGQLLKQSGFLGMWKHKYFVLEDGIFKYYKHEKDKLENNGSCKIFILKATTVLAYAKLSLVFKVINEDSGEELCLMANSKDTLDQWIEMLKLSISRKYLQNKRKSLTTLKTEGTARLAASSGHRKGN